MSYTRVSKLNPCQVCKKPDWCRVFADGWIECMRVQSDKPAKSGGWMHSGPSRSIPPLPPPRVAAPTINATKLHRDWQGATPLDSIAAFATGLGLSAPSLSALDAAYATPHAAWAFPMCDGHGNIVGIRLRNEHGKFAVRGSKQGIFIAEVPPQPTLFVCEGPTDTAAAVELGLFAVGRPNCCCGGAEIRIYARRHLCRRVVMISDNDKPGLDGARKVGADLKIYARRHQCNRVVMISDNDKPGLDGARKVGAEIRLPFAVVVPPAKDLRDFVRIGGTRVMIENTLKGTIWQNG